MKYMGSKRGMLQNGLGELIRAESKRKRRIVDLFSGSASVSWFAAQEFNKPVVSVDLQEFSVILARSVIERTVPICPVTIEKAWLATVNRRLARSKTWISAQRIDLHRGNTGSWVRNARIICHASRGAGPIWRSYGGYYFSPSQATIFDFLRQAVPAKGPERWVCLAALLMAASHCAASPGHTAQPFGTTRSAGPFLREAWLRDPVANIQNSIRKLASMHALVKGKARVGEATRFARTLKSTDLVFVDPPYSGVHYSRFYHVLETLARGGCGRVSGSGRYPPPEERPTSHFSQKGNAPDAMNRLFKTLSGVGCTVIVTFPNHECSNGLSGDVVTSTAHEYFKIREKVVKTRFSTLGGNGRNRNARKPSQELILLLRPK